MGQIEHFGNGSSPVARPTGGLAPEVPVGVPFAGRPVDYVSVRFTPEESWQILSPRMRQWAEDGAGTAIRDPHTGVPTVYWYCRVRPEGVHGPSAAAASATYELVMFGKRGLIVSTGTANSLDVEGRSTKWRHRRFNRPVDPSGVRHDHREAPADTAGGDSAPTDVSAGGGSSSLLPAKVARMFGNLPSATQRFLLVARQGDGTTVSPVAWDHLGVRCDGGGMVAWGPPAGQGRWVRG